MNLEQVVYVAGGGEIDATEVRASIVRSARAPAEARRLVDRLGLDPEAADFVRLAVSELVSNAVMHGAGRIDVAFGTADGAVRVSVADQGSGFAPHAVPDMPPPDAPGGRGLALVAMMARDWGVVRGDGTEVWCIIPADVP